MSGRWAVLARPTGPLAALCLIGLSGLVACRPEPPSAADPRDPWVRVEADGGTVLDTGALGAVELEPRPYPVTWISDGDTIKVQRGARRETVRLLGINTPETVDPRRPVQCFGREASARMKALVEGRSVWLATDPAESRYDRNGRLLAYVWLPDGTFVNLELLRGGFANEASYGTAYAYQDRFRRAALQAERAGRGLWSEATCAGDFGAPAEDFSSWLERQAPASGVAPPEGAGRASGFGAGTDAEALGSTGTASPETGPDPAKALAEPGLRIAEVVYDGDAGAAEPDEYVELRNDGPPLEVGGWWLSDAEGHVFILPDFVMATGRRCRVYTDRVDVEHCGLSYFSREPIWGNGGDRATLHDPSGREVDRRCWGRGCP